LEVDATQSGKTLSNRFGKIRAVRSVGYNTCPQDFSRLLFHRSTVASRTHPKTRLHLFI
jgi:hypothetical protein